MNIHDLKKQYPGLYQEAFARGFNAGVACQLNRGGDDPEKRRLEAAELIANAGRDRAPVNFARVPMRVAGNGGPAFVVPTY
jgi:hypothetical protein